MHQPINLEAYEQIQPALRLEHGDDEVFYATPNRATAFRVQTFFTKEPETVAWIAGFDPGDVLLDVGANVGMYSIWAAKTARARVFAFEPESQNYALLNRNIVLNKLSRRVVAYCAALSDKNSFDQLHISRFEVGQSCHSYGEAVNFNLKPNIFSLSQGAIATSLDALVQDQTVPVPRHIKIDVDGFEHKVVGGARETLTNRKVRSLLVEINQQLEEHIEAVGFLKSLGFTYSLKQVSESERLEGPFKGVANYVFRR